MDVSFQLRAPTIGAVSQLRHARPLGVNAFRSDADLNSINGVIVDLAKNLSRSGDFLGKFDTDEVLVLAVAECEEAVRKVLVG
jgi:hypothetical protein